MILVCLGLLTASYAFAREQLAAYEAFGQKRAAVSGDGFFGPVYIDGVQITGLTMDQAREQLKAHAEGRARDFEVILTAGDLRWRISSEEVPMAWDTETLLQKAYTIGRTGSLEQRYRQITSLTEPVYAASAYTYDRAKVRELTDAVAARLSQAPKDAAVVAFDVANRAFGFSEEQPGQRVDGEKLYQSVLAALDAERFGQVIEVEAEPVWPSVTKQSLMANYTRIASFSTRTTADESRNTNIRLSAEALNGQLILPGGRLSFNEATGERTRDKGYQEAGAIENGRTVKEVGGGVCQTSSTLFNALARAGCEIVVRKPHAWPSDYVPRGEDATVDWPRLDLVMQNPTDTTMFIAAFYENRTLTIEVYGLSLGEGVSIELESVTTYSKKPTEVVYTYNPALSVGTTKKIKEPRTGYSVQTYRVYLQNGVEISREAFYKSEYATINEEYEYNDGKPPAGT